MAFRNDPDLGAVPVVGDGSVDIAYRTKCGEAVRFNGDLAALVAFLGDDQFVVVGDVLYSRTAEGALIPAPTLAVDSVIVKPPAGDWFVLTELQLKSEYASVVNLAPKVHTATTSGDTPAKKAPAKKAAVKKAPAKKAAVKKAPAKKAAVKKAPAKKAAPAAK